MQRCVQVGPKRKRMPRRRQSLTPQVLARRPRGYSRPASIEAHGRLGEIFLTDIGKEGSDAPRMNERVCDGDLDLAPIRRAARAARSEVSYMRFEPKGSPTTRRSRRQVDARLHHAWVASRFLDADAQEELGILTPEVRARKAGRMPSARSSRTHRGRKPGRGPRGTAGNGAAKPATAGLTDSPPVVPAPARRDSDLGPAAAMRRHDAAHRLLPTRARAAATTRGVGRFTGPPAPCGRAGVRLNLGGPARSTAIRAAR